MQMKQLIVATVTSGILVGAPLSVAAQTARDMYQTAVAKDEALRTAVAAGDRPPVLRVFRSVVASYENIVRRFPRSGYCDDALFKGAALAKLASERFGDLRDKRTAVRLFKMLIDEYPTSSLVAGARRELDRLDPARQLVTPAPQSPATFGVSTPSGNPSPPSRSASTTADASAAARPADAVVLRSITRTLLPGTVRIALELDREVLFEPARIDNPSRVFVDLKGTIPAPNLVDAVLSYTGDLVTQVRLGRHPGPTTRVVLDAEGVARYSVFTLYEPFRLVIDCEHASAAVGRSVPPVAPELQTTQPRTVDGMARAGLPRLPQRAIEMPDVSEPLPLKTSAASSAPSPPPIPSKAAAPPVVTMPPGPMTNARGGYSLARQLGLGVSRIVLDPGHGGRDPGAKIRGLTEAEVVLDISLRLEKLLQKERGFEVVLTRRRNVFVPLERRTAIANRENADLFISIHVNANASPNTRGVETFFLNFASNAEAAAVAARENQGSGQAMHHLNDIVKAIALNNKLDESRDLAMIVQDAMIRKVRATNRNVRDLGVKQAPFVVLVGAAMPSILAEVSFITNRQEAQLLRTSAYRQRLAEALYDGILRYQRALKSAQTTAGVQ